MTDREIFRDNLNYYLSLNGKMQKDLADAIGAKYTTVSGWTRGISYPRADAMEKIAIFFGIPTSKLITERKQSPDNDIEQYIELNVEKTNAEKIKVLMQDISKLSPEDFDQLHDMFYLMFKKKLEGEKRR